MSYEPESSIQNSLPKSMSYDFKSEHNSDDNMGWDEITLVFLRMALDATSSNDIFNVNETKEVATLP